MSYPDSYCVKCKAHTDTLGKHTIMLGNNRRALKGVCPVCATETYRFMPKKDESKPAPKLSVISTLKPMKGQPIQRLTEPLPGTSARFVDKHGRPSRAQEIFFFGSLLVVFGLMLAVGSLLILGML